MSMLDSGFTEVLFLQQALNRGLNERVTLTMVHDLILSVDARLQGQWSQRACIRRALEIEEETILNAMALNATLKGAQDNER